jgi:hypothetical protein
MSLTARSAHARELLRRLAQLEGRRRALLAYGFGWVVLSRAALAAPRGSLPTTLRWLQKIAGRLPAPPRFSLDEAAWAITAVAGRLPGTRCLPWAIALHELFTQAGIASELCIGVTADGPSAIRAHAWVEAAGRCWSWGDAAGYSLLMPPSGGARGFS